MGVIIKYQLEFPGIGLKVANDFYSGNFLVDADIEVTMERGAAGCRFEIKLYDLPLSQAKKLDEATNKRVKINLGYVDGTFESVMQGFYREVRSVVEGDKLIATIKGLEAATHALTNTEFQDTFSDEMAIEEVARTLLERAGIEEVDRTIQTANLEGTLTDVVLRGENALQVLGELAEYADAELLVCDRQVRLGKPIADDSYQPKAWSRDTNIAQFKPFKRSLPEETGRNLLHPLPATEASGFEFTILGDPKLRPAHKVIAEVENYNRLAGADFRIHSLVHSLTMSGGYICKGKGVATKVCTDENCRRRETEASRDSAESAARRVIQSIQSEQSRRPTVEVTQVQDYDPEHHLSHLYFGQRFERTQTQPSIRAEVENNARQVLRNKPIVSPFAWHKCGLVTPIYPGMKALVNHNLNLPNDALVMGFIWSETPEIEPPQNQAGDWWLCLPIDFDSAQPPNNSTKAVNDLTANDGKRVVEVKGLKITVGNDSLNAVGERPELGADNEFLIEHKSGTKIKIAADGTVEIEAQSIAIQGDVTITGSLEIR